MTLPDPSKVEKGWRWLAYVLTVLFVVSLLAFVASDAVSIYTSRKNPPIITSAKDGELLGEDNRSSWGPLPGLMISTDGGCNFQTQLYESSDDRLKLADLFDVVGGTVPPERDEAGYWSFHNLTVLVPKFGKTKETLDKHVKVKPYVRIGIAGPGCYLVQGVFIDTVDPEDTSIEHPVEQMIVPAPDVGSREELKNARRKIININIVKEVVPRAGIFLGLPWEGTHTRLQYKLASGGEQLDVDTSPDIDGWTPWMILKIQVDPMIAASQPVSILAQIYNMVAKLGGALTAFGTLFYFMFVPKYQQSRGEITSGIMSIRGAGGCPREDAAE